MQHRFFLIIEGFYFRICYLVLNLCRKLKIAALEFVWVKKIESVASNKKPQRNYYFTPTNLRAVILSFGVPSTENALLKCQ